MVTPNLLEPGDVFGVYRIEEYMLNDGPIQSYFATNTSIAQKINFLCLDSRPSENTPSRIEAFHRAAAQLQSLDDPCLAKLYDAGVTDRIYWAATEYFSFDRLALSAILGNQGERFSPTSCLITAGLIANALRTAWEARVMHLRLNPDRILVDRKYKVADKITGVGIAQLFSLTPSVIRLEPAYAAPEQLRDKSKAIDPRADIYALGMVLYAMLAWAPPFADKAGKVPTTDRLLLQAMTRTPPPLQERVTACPDFLDVFVQSLVVKPRADRPREWETVMARHEDIMARYGIYVETMD